MTRINSTRLPATARIDARLTVHPSTAAGRWTFYFDVINVLDRRNREAVFSDLVYDPASTRPRVDNSYGGGFPLLPTAGLRVRF
jgi:hypothetical protein